MRCRLRRRAPPWTRERSASRSRRWPARSPRTTSRRPSTPGAPNLLSGQPNGAIMAPGTTPSSNLVDDGHGGLTLIGDTDPLNDICSDPQRQQNLMQSKNVGDLLNDAGITWGAFMGG